MTEVGAPWLLSRILIALGHSYNLCSELPHQNARPLDSVHCALHFRSRRLTLGGKDQYRFTASFAARLCRCRTTAQCLDRSQYLPPYSLCRLRSAWDLLQPAGKRALIAAAIQ